MKLINRSAFFFGIVFMSTILIQGCGGDGVEEDTIEEAQLKKLTKTWTVDAVTLDGVPQTGYNGFTLTFSGELPTFDYAVSSRPELGPWPASGTCSFDKDNPETKLIRSATPSLNDELNMTYAVTDSKLTISFTYSGPGYEGGRVLNVKGNWVFNFI